MKGGELVSYDGEILINTEIDTEGAEKGTSDLLKAVRELTESVRNLSSDMRNAFSGVAAQAGSAEKEITKTARSADGLGNSLKQVSENSPVTKEFSALCADIDRTHDSLGKLNDRLLKYGELGVDSNSRQWKSLQYDIEQAKNSLASLIQYKNEMLSDGSAYVLLNPQDMGNVHVRLANGISGTLRELENMKTGTVAVHDETEEVRREVELVKGQYSLASTEAAKTATNTAGIGEAAYSSYSALQRLGTFIRGTFTGESLKLASTREQQAEFDNLSDKVAHYRGLLQELEGRGSGFGDSRFDAVYQSLYMAEAELRRYKAALEDSTMSQGRCSRVGSVLSSALGRIRSAAASAADSVKKYVSDTKKANGASNRLGKGLFRLGNMFKMLVIRMAMRAVITAVREGFQNLARYSETTNVSLSSLKSSLTQLKNSFATAFAPIVTAVMPVLTGLINMLSRAISNVGMFFAAITGKDTFVKAKSVQEDYAASLNNTADAAKSAKDALNRYLSPLDEVSRYETKTAAGSGTAGTVSPGDMFEEVPVENSVKGFAERIKALFAAEDWEGLGTFAADCVNLAFSHLYEAFSWENVSPRITSTVRALTRTFNSMVDGIDWGLIGRTIGAGGNTIVNTLQELVSGINWRSIGKSIGAGINGLFDEFDFKALGRLIGDKIKAVLDILVSMIEETDWQLVGESIIDFICGIDWSGIVTGIVEGIGAVIGGLASMLWGLIKDVWDSVVQWWQDAAHEDGKFTIKGLLSGILDVILNIGTWIKEHIFDPFINGIKKAFKIHSPSKVMEEIGVYIMQGLLNGISSLVKNVTDIFGGIKDRISDKWDEVRKNTSEKWDYIKTGLVTVWDSAREGASEFGSGIREKVDNAWNRLKNSTSGIWGNISTSLSGTWNSTRLAAARFSSGVRDGINESWNNISGNTTRIWGNIRSGLSDTFVTIRNNASGFAMNVKNSVVNAWSQMKNSVSSIWNGVVTAVKNPVNKILYAINCMIAGIVNGINSMIRALNSLSFSIPDWLPGIGGKSFGLNIGYMSAPQIPYLATGAVIPPNAPFMAVLGDQRHGTNIETPEALLRKVVREESGGSGTGGRYTFVGQINRRTLFEEFIDEAKARQARTGRNPLDLGRV